MHSSLEHIDACLPVIALKALVLRDTRLLIQGRGPYCQVIDEQNGKLLAELKVFRRNNIHGFILLSQNQRDLGSASSRLVVWGGSSLRVIDLSLDSSDASESNKASLRAVTAEYLAPDWILAGCAPESGNKAERAFVVTAHNAILGLHVVENVDSKYAHAVHVQQLVSGVKSILYSADAISLSSSRVLIAAGTVFGEIIVWSCFIDENESNPLKLNAAGSIHHFFTGHEGSIFGVRISPLLNSLPGHRSGRLLASCSDDRTIRVWDISDCEKISRHDRSAYSTDGFELRTTGFGSVAATGDESGPESCVAKAFGHAARIWGVHFVPTATQDQTNLTIVSRGEDATCILWDLSWGASCSPKAEFKLTQISSSHLHTGKHLWSLDMNSTGSQTTIYTGGADGAVRCFTIDVNENASISLPNRDNRIVTSSDTQNIVSTRDKSFKAFAFVSSDHFVATTFQGEVQLGSVQSRTDAGRLIFKETLFVEEDLRAFSVIGSLPQKGLALIANALGLVRLYNHGTKSLDKVAQADGRPLRIFPLQYDVDAQRDATTLSFVTSYATLRKADLFCIGKSSTAEPHFTKTELTLPHGMEVSCASWIDHQYLALGIKSGALLVYKVAEMGGSLEPILCTLRIHGREGVNAITQFSTMFGEAGSLPDYFMTCGRDGDYCIHELADEGGSEVRIRTIHRSSPAVSFNVEGFYIDPLSKDFILYGFQSTEFILWNETAHSELARVDCGGARRMWAFHPSNETSGAGLLLWVQSGFNALQIQPNVNRTIRAGGHGREIKTMEVAHSTSERGTLIATGAEDTHLRIFAPASPHTESLWASFKCLRVLRDHTAGVQQISWSTDGKTLFSSAGFEELFVWKVRQIPSFGLATALAASSPKDDPMSELRVTSFDVLDVEEEQAKGGFLLCLALSNSTIKIFHYSSSVDEGHFTLLARGTYTSNCLTQARFLVTSSSIGLITASTDGHFTLWHLNPVLEPFYSMASSSVHLRQPLETLSINPSSITCENRYQIHSNSIKSLEMARISADTSLILAGGDDNALTVSVLTVDFTNTDAGSHVCTVTIPDAHAASVTTIKILKQQQLDGEGKAQIFFASSGNDHQVKVWCAEVDVPQSGSDGVKVKNLVDQYSGVADISSLDLITDESGMQLLVCGVGMELFKLQLP
ncbi:tRNA (34-2'-O)-methyltransferase regulator RTT10 [Aspergillus clavatus NRRL 1]|uniref:WD repeat protein n=1 Tax=Aspergillus clavatus (strain ATCC 1007 / CBS 513.65 / DSM 816 / NCTC 3887 / NRRL 1 / QM 1276 / 107) TaxID=344612 RepID=A1CT39_ASPCL|nr:WD repeat protein [Aspergillus clavatus NRRL 1]EAW06476.1 WD repeat protein [Aspergillus clavatus NRRL 1]